MASTETIEQVKQRIEEIDPVEAREELEGRRRRPDRHPRAARVQEAHLEGAELVRPVDVADEHRGGRRPTTRQRVILYCRSGNRSARAADQLRELGYENVASVAGGIMAWQEQGLPVVGPRA